MPHKLDCQFARLGIDGYAGGLNGRTKSWLEHTCATSTDLPALWACFLALQGWTGHRMEAQFNWLGAQGYTGALPDRRKGYWCEGMIVIPPDPITVALGIRVRNVQLPAEATITKALLNLTAWGASPAGGIVDIYADQANQPADYLSIPPSERDLSEESVRWNITPLADGETVTSPDLSELLEPLVNHPSWSAGQDMGVVLVPVSGALAFYSHEAADGDGSKQPSIDFWYAGGVPPPESGSDRTLPGGATRTLPGALTRSIP